LAVTALAGLVGTVLRVWPEHEQYVRERFTGCDERHLVVCDGIARRICAIIAADPEDAIRNYRWTCEMMLEEEYFFRRTGSYRHTSFAEVRARVYDDAEFMRRYSDGLLLSQVLWSNHAHSLQTYETDFLANLDAHGDLLEVGPGHGLLLALAAERCRGKLVGWDISPGSVVAARRALLAMGVPEVQLECRDLLTAPVTAEFDAVVASELLEHLEEPAVALRRLGALTRPGGRLFLNIPVNSPAPDHITLWRTPEEIEALLAMEGLETEAMHTFPMTGKSLTQARADGLSVSCVAICRKPPRDASACEKTRR